MDHRRKLALLSRDPRAYAGSTMREPGEPDPNGATNIAGVYVIDAQGSARSRDPQLPAAADGSHHDLRERLQVALDRRSGGDAEAAGSAAQLDLRPADHRHRPDRPAQPAGLPDGSGRPLPPRRRDRLLARRAGGRHGHRLGLGRRRHARLLDAWLALGSAGGALAQGQCIEADPLRRRRHRGGDHRRRHRRLRAQRGTAGGLGRAQGRPALPARQAAAQHRGGLRTGQ